MGLLLSAMAVEFIATGLLALSPGLQWEPNPQADNKLGKAQMNNRLPFILDLPSCGEYIEILGKHNAYCMRSGLVTLAPGQDVGMHSTEDFEEMIIVLEGDGELETDSLGRRKIARGQVAYNPPDTRHNVINTGETRLRYIYVVSKAT